MFQTIANEQENQMDTHNEMPVPAHHSDDRNGQTVPIDKAWETLGPSHLTGKRIKQDSCYGKEFGSFSEG